MKSQETRVLQYFQCFPLEALTPPEVKVRVGLSCPLTSVRRALTVLTRQGLLVKTDETGQGLWHLRNRKWSLNQESHPYA